MSKSWEHQEKRLAKVLGGQRSAGSGAFDRKGDVRAATQLWETKWTGKKSFTVKAEVLEKIIGEALAEGRTPVLGLELNGRNYVIVEEGDWLEASDG